MQLTFIFGTDSGEPRSFTVQTLPIRKAKEWRALIGAPFDQLVTGLASAGAIELTDGNSLANLLGLARNLLIGSVDQIWDWLLAYAPALAADSDWILDHGTDDEVMTAFLEVVKIAYPLGRLVDLFRTTGSAARTTSKKLPSAPTA